MVGNRQPRDGGVRAKAELCLQKAGLAWVWEEGDRNPTRPSLSTPPGVPVQLGAEHGSGALQTEIGEDRTSEPKVGACHHEGSCVWCESIRERGKGEREKERDRDFPSLTLLVSIR